MSGFWTVFSLTRGCQHGPLCELLFFCVGIWNFLSLIGCLFLSKQRCVLSCLADFWFRIQIRGCWQSQICPTLAAYQRFEEEKIFRRLFCGYDALLIGNCWHFWDACCLHCQVSWERASCVEEMVTFDMEWIDHQRGHEDWAPFQQCEHWGDLVLNRYWTPHIHSLRAQGICLVGT